ncbi:hypothetical protein GUJ93_ZPchr0003g18341 [Zizania palustris]|uniref:Gag-pol polyprotein n=1 Tax=Zizania palustris TaxID=103762 RepID=A0A8J5S9R8_ZIZPA|nr:hypothetical protein GUJ93_ZPchr0003g18341 [Zizania palustris]
MPMALIKKSMFCPLPEILLAHNNHVDKAERELQGLQPRSKGNSIDSRSAPTTVKTTPPAWTAAPFESRSRPATPSARSIQEAKGRSSASSAPANSSSSVASIGRSSGVICHNCKGKVHIMRDCLSQPRMIIATKEGGYISSSKIEVAIASGIDNAGNEEADRKGEVWDQNGD